MVENIDHQICTFHMNEIMLIYRTNYFTLLHMLTMTRHSSVEEI